MVCKTEGTWLGEELEEMGHMVHRVVMEKEPSNRQRMTACCLAANPICLLSHHLRQPQSAREMGREEPHMLMCHMLTLPDVSS